MNKYQWYLSYICTFGLTEGKNPRVTCEWLQVSVNSTGDIVYLFIGTGRSPNKITFMSLPTNHNHNINYQGLCGPFLFKSDPSSYACHHAEALSIVTSAYIFMYLLTYHLAESVFAWRTFNGEEGPPTQTNWSTLGTLLLTSINMYWGGLSCNLN
jgi:hypothetical protein